VTVPARGRGSFGPVVLLGLGAAALAAVAGTRTWTDVEAPGGDCSAAVPPGVVWADFERDAPLAAAVALVLLAAWGVVLVTRGRVRRAMALVGTLAAAGYVAVAVAAPGSLKEASRDAAQDRIGDLGNGCHAASVWMNNDWWLVALVAGPLAVLAGVLAVWLAPHWPEMGSRYDAPSGAAAGAGGSAKGGVDELSNIDIWKSLDAGQDPTLDPKRPEDPSS
jgi:uncharacterized membrane protein (TIGR02234 family)